MTASTGADTSISPEDVVHIWQECTHHEVAPDHRDDFLRRPQSATIATYPAEDVEPSALMARDKETGHLLLSTWLANLEAVDQGAADGPAACQRSRGAAITRRPHRGAGIATVPAVAASPRRAEPQGRSTDRPTRRRRACRRSEPHPRSTDVGGLHRVPSGPAGQDCYLHVDNICACPGGSGVVS